MNEALRPVASQDGRNQLQQSSAADLEGAEHTAKLDAQLCACKMSLLEERRLTKVLASELEQERRLVQVLIMEMDKVQSLSCALEQQLQQKEEQLQHANQVRSSAEGQPAGKQHLTAQNSVNSVGACDPRHLPSALCACSDTFCTVVQSFPLVDNSCRQTIRGRLLHYVLAKCPSAMAYNVMMKIIVGSISQE